MCVLNVAEKPSVAREVSRILSCNNVTHRNGVYVEWSAHGETLETVCNV